MSDYEYGGGCCPGCCRAGDYGGHDFCSPCDSSPWCSKPYSYRYYDEEADTPRAKTPVPVEKNDIKEKKTPKVDNAVKSDKNSNHVKADNADKAGKATKVDNDDKEKQAVNASK